MTQSIQERSLAQIDQIALSKTIIPGGSTNSLLPPNGLEFLVDRGEGAYLYDVDGRRFLDFMIGAGPLLLGHAHPRMVETIATQAQRGTHYFNLTAAAVQLAERVCRIVPSAQMVRYTSSGSEATFHALRLARAVTGRQAIIKFDGAWHGHHDLAVFSMEYSPTQIPVPYAISNGIQKGVTDEVVVLPYNDATAFRAMMRAYPGRFAAVICEPMQRTLNPLPGFLETLREECDAAGTALIFDEVVSGFRIAPGGAQEKYGVTPDLTALGKAFGGGMPLAAVVGQRRFMEHLDPNDGSNQYSFHCGTFNGLPMSIACAHTALDVLVDEDGIGRLAELGLYARDRLKGLFQDLNRPACITGDGPIFHFYLTEEQVHDHAAVRRADNAFSDAVHRRMYKAGIYKQFSKAYLSLAHDKAHIDEFCDVLRWAYLQEVSA
ncbi:aspartate aminotransferase family protein [Sphingobium sp. CR2-8]|uniref:aspartate aminotransferase family protein n=1 Tax=Sphingobium sp. CR2-8 TaxID=1306534 RepID=UPI002DBEA4F6|nr:aspartate aminotransferase family protein [Sphingobium sp. CR2-8]MEC3909445.1 aspartate aminotransferase family protein [Sphingobium sp. CR2-8]